MTTHTHNRHQHAQPVRIVVGNPIAEHRARETRHITGVLTAVCGLAAGCAIVPAVADATTTVVLALLAALAAAGLARWVIRRARWWCEDRADARTAATWHTQQGAGQNSMTRAGVA